MIFYEAFKFTCQQIVYINKRSEMTPYFLQAIAYLVVTFSLTHSLTHSLSHSGLFKLAKPESLCLSKPFLMVPVWSFKVLYGPVWSIMVPYGPIWSRMAHQGPVWSIITHYGNIWPSVATYASVWPNMTLYVPVLSLTV